MGEKVTPRQRKAIEALLTTATVRSAADAAGVARKTVYAWLKQPAFRAALSEAEDAALSEVTRGLAALGLRAVATLDRTMTSDGAPAGVRVRAADVTLARLLQLRELLDLAERVAELEERIGGDK